MFYNCFKLNGLGDLSTWNTSNITDMGWMFYACKALTNVGDLSKWGTSKVTNMSNMFNRCNSITSIPLFDTSKVTDMSYMFELCYKVETGALALYNQVSSQANPPTNHEKTFYNCGSDTVNGAAELAQIPSDWK